MWSTTNCVAQRIPFYIKWNVLSNQLGLIQCFMHTLDSAHPCSHAISSNILCQWVQKPMPSLFNSKSSGNLLKRNKKCSSSLFFNWFLSLFHWRREVVTANVTYSLLSKGIFESKVQILYCKHDVSDRGYNFHTRNRRHRQMELKGRHEQLICPDAFTNFDDYLVRPAIYVLFFNNRDLQIMCLERVSWVYSCAWHLDWLQSGTAVGLRLLWL